MNERINSLDHLAFHEEIRMNGGQCPACASQSRRGGCSCGGSCSSCSGGHQHDAYESNRTRRARAPARPRVAPRATRAQRSGAMGQWRGWTRPVTMQQLIDARARYGTRPLTAAQLRQVPPALRPFLRPGVNIYRMSIPQQGRAGPYLSIGMTQGQGQTVAGRARQHYQVPSAGEPHLYQVMNPQGRNPVDPSRILVQAGGIPAGMAPRLAHLYEIWLQHRERVSDWNQIRDTRTFEEEALADLIVRTTG